MPYDLQWKNNMSKKKLLLIAIIGLPICIVSVIAWTTIQFNFYSTPDAVTAIDQASLAYFPDSYESSRNTFRKKALELKEAYPNASLTAIPIPGKVDIDLAVDVLYIPAQRTKRRLLIVSSGVHGVEGFVGSAVERMLMEEFVTNSLLDTTGVLVIHAINPYGFKHLRRVTENNVDLNRNSDTDPGLFSTLNSGYPGVNDLVNPASKVDVRSVGNIFFHLRVLARILPISMKVFRQAVAQGQYKFPRGILFGGKAFEPQVAALPEVLTAALNEYPLIMNIDLHTGYGERGTLHLFPNPIHDESTRSKMERVFKGRRIDWGDGDDFYTVTGDFSIFLGKIATNSVYLPMIFEYGSLNSQNTLGAFKTLHITLLENQGVQHGYASPADEAKVKRDFRELFYPSSPAWRTKVISDTREILRSALEEFAKL